EKPARILVQYWFTGGWMRVATGRIDGRRAVGWVSGEIFQPLRLDGEGDRLGALAVVQRAVAGAPAAPPQGSPVPLARVALEAPVPRPLRTVFCVGKNYHEHAHEFARSGFDSSAASGAVPDAPIIFSKVPESVTAPGSAIRFDPTVSTAIDYEAELAVV